MIKGYTLVLFTKCGTGHLVGKHIGLGILVKWTIIFFKVISNKMLNLTMFLDGVVEYLQSK